jgi:hypothetical protein
MKKITKSQAKKDIPSLVKLLKTKLTKRERKNALYTLWRRRQVAFEFSRLG